MSSLPQGGGGRLDVRGARQCVISTIVSRSLSLIDTEGNALSGREPEADRSELAGTLYDYTRVCGYAPDVGAPTSGLSYYARVRRVDVPARDNGRLSSRCNRFLVRAVSLVSGIRWFDTGSRSTTARRERDRRATPEVCAIPLAARPVSQPEADRDEVEARHRLASPEKARHARDAEVCGPRRWCSSRERC
jgi:hypothetical protein